MERPQAPCPDAAPASMLAYIEDMLLELADLAGRLDRQPLSLAIRDAASAAKDPATASEAAPALRQAG